MEHAILHETIEGQQVNFYPETGFDDVMETDGDDSVTLRMVLANIDAAIALVGTNAFPKAGGALTGNEIKRNVDNDLISIRGGSGANKGSRLALYGQDNESGGEFDLQAYKTSGGNVSLHGTPSGLLTWNGHEIHTSANSYTQAQVNSKLILKANTDEVNTALNGKVDQITYETDLQGLKFGTAVVGGVTVLSVTVP